MLEVVSIMLLVMSIANLVLSGKPYAGMNQKQLARLNKQYAAYCAKQAKKGLQPVPLEEYPAVLKSSSIKMLIISIVLIIAIECFAFFVLYRNMF